MMLKEGKDYILEHEISHLNVDLVAERVVSRIEDYWDNLLRKEENESIDPIPDNSLVEDIRDNPLRLLSSPKKTGHGKKSGKPRVNTPEKSTTSSEGRLVIDEGQPRSEDDMFA